MRWRTGHNRRHNKAHGSWALARWGDDGVIRGKSLSLFIDDGSRVRVEVRFKRGRVLMRTKRLEA